MLKKFYNWISNLFNKECKDLEETLILTEQVNLCPKCNKNYGCQCED